MQRDCVILNLPKDLGDNLLCAPVVKALQDYCAAEGLDLVAMGGKMSREWSQTLGGTVLDCRDPATEKFPPARFLVNLNFYDDTLVEKHFRDVACYAPEKLVVVAEDGAAFGTGAVVGKKHISALLDDCLRDAGVLKAGEKLPIPSLPPSFLDDAFVDATVKKFDIRQSYVVIIPVCAANRPLKRWEPEKFSWIIQQLAERGIQPVLIGGPSADEKKLCEDIRQMSGGIAMNLCGETSLAEIAALARYAVFTLGNDTGPTHIAAGSGGPVFSFFGYYNDANTWRPVTKDNTAHVLLGTTIQSQQAADVLDKIYRTIGLKHTPAPLPSKKLV